MKIRNVREYGLEIAATGQIVGPGAAVEVDAKLGASLVEQTDNWQPVTSGSKPVTAGSKKGDN